MHMATLTPKVLVPTGSFTSSASTYVSPAGGFGVIRTINACPTTTSITLTVSLGADAAGTRILALQPLTANQVYTLNGWIITPTNSAHAIDVTSNATGTQCQGTVSGYEWV
jgi:hypothetical protein